MKPSILSLSRLEFEKINIEINPKFIEEKGDFNFPQLDFNFNKVSFNIASSLAYPDAEIEDPRHFTLTLRLSVRQDHQEDGIIIPYSVTIEGRVYLHFKGSDEGIQRFSAIRNTGYMMLWGAFREQVANFTSRSGHGLWFLPSPNFKRTVDEEAPKDIELWEQDKARLKLKNVKRVAQIGDRERESLLDKASPEPKSTKRRRKPTTDS